MPKIYHHSWLGCTFLENLHRVFGAIFSGDGDARRHPQSARCVARNMGAKEHEIMWQVVLPAASPQILTGLQVALPISLIVAIIAEMVMGGYGLGGAMMGASRFANSPGVFAGIVEIAVVGYALIKIMALARRRLLVWHQETAERT